MKDFFRLLLHYVAPYKRYLFGSLLFNLLSAVLNVFSFLSLMPMLKILFRLDTTRYTFIPWDTPDTSFKDILLNNLYYYTTDLIHVYGASTALLFIGLFLIAATLLKTSCYFASVGIMVPMRTGIVRDIRSSVYHKIVSLPLSFFSDERKGDIMARMSGDVGAVILTGNGPSPRDGGWAFSSGGDQRIRGRDGYRYEREASPQSPTAAGEPEDRAYSHEADVAAAQARLDTARAGRLHILEVQRLIRTMPKAVIAAVPGWAAGGGHSLNVVCDLSLASIEHARFKQTDADVGSFDAGYGSALLARQVGDKRAREIFFLARTYDAVTAERWGVVNEAVPHAELEERALEYAATVAGKSPQAIRMLKLAFNLADDGLAGQQVFAGEATRLAYMTDEAVEGRDAFLQRRTPDWSPFPYYF